jgi:HAD superfamily hydrolase (TIGR01509 family)
MPLKAVLFDFDGVIAETENHHVVAWQRVLSVMGWQVPDEIAVRAAEVDDRDFVSNLFTLRGMPVDQVDQWVRRKQLLTVDLLRNAPRLYPGVVDVVRSLRPKVRLAVVSGTWRENIQVVLESTGLADAFEVIVGKQDVSAQKPAPEAYHVALKRLRLSARSAVAVEDSPTGLSAARGAGLRVIAVGHRHPAGEWSGEAPFIPGFEPAAGLLAHLGL